MSAIRIIRPALVAAVCMLAGFAAAQEGQGDPAAPPTTNLPFAPTIQSAPPENPTYPQPVEPAPPPGDPLCYEIGPIIRAGVVASRFATLSPATGYGGVIGRHETGDALKELGADYCTVVIPAANPATANSAWNQVTCQLQTLQGDVAFLDDLRSERAELAARIADCPAMSRWTGFPPSATPLTEDDIVEDYLFTHPDVWVEVVIRARQHKKSGQWPLDYVRTLSLVFRTVNPDRPEPPEPPEMDEAPVAETASATPG